MNNEDYVTMKIPILPKEVIEHLRFLKKTEARITDVSKYTADSKVIKWFKIKGNDELFAQAWITNKWKELEKQYYAKIKGWELIDKGAIEAYEFDVEQGVEGLPPDASWGRNVYIIQQSNGDLVVDMKDSGLSGAKHFMTENEWYNLGIDVNNAVFEDVEESLLWRLSMNQQQK